MKRQDRYQSSAIDRIRVGVPGVVGISVLVVLASVALASPSPAEWLRKPKDGSTAVLTSVSATFVPIIGGLAIAASDNDALVPGAAVFAGGLILGPWAGYVYAQEESRGAKGIAVRFGIAAGAAAITALVSASQPHGGFMDFSGLAVTLGVAAGGCGLVLLHGIYDTARLPGVVGEHNRSLQPGCELRAAPFVREGGRTVGASLTWSFR